MGIEKYIKRENFEDFQTQINNLAKQKKLLESSVVFLSEKINDFKKNGRLEDYEHEYIKNQIKYHEELLELKKDFLRNKDMLTKKSISEIDDAYKEIEWTTISESEVEYIRWKTKFEKSKIADTLTDISYRDYVEKNIDIEWWIETVYEWEENERFLDYFTVYYLDYIEKFYSEKDIAKKHKKIEKWLIISKNEIDLILYKMFNEKWKELNNYNNNLTINLKWKKERFFINSVKRNVTNERKREKRIKKEKAEYEEKIKSLDEALEKIYNEKNKNPDSDNTDELILIESLLEQWIITKDELLRKSEKYKTFNYLDFLDRYWLCEALEWLYLDMFTKKMMDVDVYYEWKVIKITPEFINTNKVAIINNFTILNKIIVWIESDWKNRDNKKWSWAKWFFQFHTANGSKGRSKWKFNSFETALRRNYIEFSNRNYIKNEKLEQDKNVPKWIIEAYNNKNSDPKKLTTIQQNSLFIVDMFNNWKEVKNWLWQTQTVHSYLWLVSIWNLWSAEKFYEFFHHTSPDDATMKRIKHYSKKYNKEFIRI